MTTLSIGKLRGLQQCATAHDAFSVFALDHRGSLRRALRPAAPDSVTSEVLSTFKQQVVALLAPEASAVLLDPEVGAAQCVAAGVVPGQVGLVLALEATGYEGNPTARQSNILPGWSVAKAKRMGASAIKFLVYYHPDASTAPELETVVRQVAEDCADQDIALFLEPVSYSLDPERKKLSAAERRWVVIETARRLVSPGIDVLKAEFPLDVAAEPNEDQWATACAELSQASSAPWVLLSAGVDYETYLRQVTVACRSGASGVAVGRAVWKEATDMTGQSQIDFFQNQARRRMARLTALCNALARPWTDFYTPPVVGAAWYKQGQVAGGL